MQACRNEALHFVHATFGFDERRMVFVKFQQALAVARESKEVALLFDDFGRRLVDRATIAGLLEFLLGVVAFATDAVEPLVVPKVDVAVCGDATPQLLHPALVTLRARPDEVIGLTAELRPRFLEDAAHVVRKCLRCDPALLCRALDLESVLVGAGEKKRIVPAERSVTLEHITHDGRVGAAEMRNVVDVIDRRGDVIRAHR